MTLTAAVAAAGLTIGLSPASEGSRADSVAHGRCELAHSRTLAKTAAARVYRRNGNTYGCLYSANRRFELGEYFDDDFGEQGQRNVRLAGRYVAFEDFLSERHFVTFTVNVFDLRTGRLVSTVDTGKTPGGDFVAGNGPTTQIRLRATGQVAWITRDISTSGAGRYEVHERERRSRPREAGRLLAAGPDIDPQSLGLVGNRLSWRQGGQRKHATLGPVPKRRQS